MSSQKEIKKVFKDIAKYRFNWDCNCRTCCSIKKIILQYNQDNIKKGDKE